MPMSTRFPVWALAKTPVPAQEGVGVQKPSHQGQAAP
jgi:hypothetical protein